MYAICLTIPVYLFGCRYVAVTVAIVSVKFSLASLFDVVDIR